MPRLSLALAAFAILLLGSGCGAGKSYEPIAAPMQLPTKAELTEVARRPIPPVVARPEVQVDSWSFSGRWVESNDAPAAQPAVQEALTSAGTLANDPQLNCLAEQGARFFSQHGATPGRRLMAYMAARCGSLAYPAMAMGAVGITGPEDASDDDVLARLLPRLKQQLASMTQTRREKFIAGAWLHREGPKATIGFVAMPQQFHMTQKRIDAQRVAIRGAITDPSAVRVMGTMSQGPFGWGDCQVRGAPAQFEMVCTLGAGDASGWVDVTVQRQGHLMARTVARTLVHRDGPGAVTFPAATVPAPVGDPTTFRVELLNRLNRVRQQAGLAPLALAPQQSASLDGVAAHYFAASKTGDETTVDKITLGTLAGWDVEGGLIRDAHVLGLHLPVRRDVQAWLDEALERPIGRSTLLAPWARQLALGAAFDRPTPGIGALLATYEFMDERAVAEEAKRVVARLNAARAARGHGPVYVVEHMPELDEAAVRVAAGVHPGRALDEALQAAVERRTVSMGGSWALAGKVDDIPFTGELLETPTLEIAVRVAHISIQGSKWGFTVVLLTTARGPRQRQMASMAGSPPPG